MKQFIFRARQKSPAMHPLTGETVHPLVEGAYFYSPEEDVAYIIRKDVVEGKHWDSVEVEKDTVCLYTGLSARWMTYDNELQKIDVWEHDVLEFKTDLDDKTGVSLMAEVVFDASAGGFVLVSSSFEDGYAPLSMFIEVEDGAPFIDAENLGNIDEIPDFIKEEWIN